MFHHKTTLKKKFILEQKHTTALKLKLHPLPLQLLPFCEGNMPILGPELDQTLVQWEHVFFPIFLVWINT